MLPSAPALYTAAPPMVEASLYSDHTDAADADVAARRQTSQNCEREHP